MKWLLCLIVTIECMALSTSAYSSPHCYIYQARQAERSKCVARAVYDQSFCKKWKRYNEWINEKIEVSCEEYAESYICNTVCVATAYYGGHCVETRDECYTQSMQVIEE